MALYRKCLFAWMLVGTSLILVGCPLPVAPKAPTVVAAIAAGGAHTCATLSDGRVKCWGSNFSGQLGNASTTNSNVPVVVIGATALPLAGGVAPGGDHTCVIWKDTPAGGRVACTGSNFKGQLGNGTRTDFNVLQPVQRITSASSIAAGEFHTCALQGTAVGCWGAYGVRGVPSVVPVVVQGVTATAVAARGHHTCVIESAGTVKCWTGANYTPLTPSQGITISATAIAVGDSHACAIVTAPTGVKCWGRNRSGELGDGTNTDSYVPVWVRYPFLPGERAIALAAGNSHTCMVSSTGFVACWGWNDYGQLGNGTRQASPYPVPVVGLSNVPLSNATAVALGDAHSCAFLNDGRVACWGWNRDGQLGNGTNYDSLTFVWVSGLP